MAPLEIDTGLPAQATSIALQTTQAYAAPEKLQFYGAWFCPFVQRTWITLLEKKIPHQYIEHNPYRKEPWYLELHPKGLVPTLVVKDGEKEEGTPIIDSSVISEWLDDHYDNEGKEKKKGDASNDEEGLLPKDGKSRQEALAWIEHINKKIIPLFYKTIQHQPHSTYTLEEARESLQSSLVELIKSMGPESEGPWFLGEKFSMVDITLIPWARRLWLIDHYKEGGSNIPPNAMSTDESILWRRYGIWKDAVDRRTSVIDTTSEDDNMILAYKRYADDTTGSMVGKATRGGEALP